MNNTLLGEITFICFLSDGIRQKLVELNKMSEHIMSLSTPSKEEGRRLNGFPTDSEEGINSSLQACF